MEIYQKNQYDKVESYIMCYPVNFKITDKSNKFYNKINYDLLYNQYNNFVNELIENNIKIKFINISKSPEQVYTRDIGFVIEDIFFISNMKMKQRKNEIIPLKELIEVNNLKYYEMKNNIEGGDVILYDNVIFLGISSRTTIKAAEELQEKLNEEKINMKVIPIYFDTSQLHLDCVFNILDSESAIISPYIYDEKIIKKYIKNLYSISKEDAKELGINFVALGDKKVIVTNKNVYNLLMQKGYDVRFLDYTEIIKAGGSLACSTLPILRKRE